MTAPRRSGRALALAVASLLALPPVVALAADHAEPVTLADRGIGRQSVRGADAVATAFVPIPAGEEVAGGVVDLRFDHSPLLRPDRSTVTLLAGDVPIASARLTAKNARGGRLRARLPALPDAEGGLTLTARFTMRLTDDRCEDPRNGALWATVDPSTRVQPVLRPAHRDLGTAIGDLVPAAGDVLRFDLPARPRAAELRAAGDAATAVGRRAARSGDDVLVAAPGDTPAPGPTVRVRSGSALTADDGGPAAPAAAPGTGVLAVAREGDPELLLGGGDDRGLARASASLTADRLTPATGRSALVRAAPPTAPARSRPWREGAASFAQLGIGTREVTGPGRTTVDLTVPRPPSWVIRDGARLRLVVDAGATLDDDASAVTATVAGREVGSRSLRPGAGPVRLDFDLPAGLVDTDLQGRAIRNLPVTLTFDLASRTGECEATDDPGQVVVSDASSIELPHDTTDARDLSRFPSPLGAGAPVAIVVPDAPTPEELSAGLQVAAAVGRRSAGSSVLPRLVRAGDLRPGDRAKADLVLIGRAGRQLGRPVGLPGGARVPGGEGGLVVAASPWASSRTAVAVLGEGSGLVRAGRALARTSTATALVGSAVRVVPAAGPEALAAGDPQGQPPDELVPVVETGFWHDLPTWAIPAAVTLVALLLVGVAVVRRRWWRPRSG